MIPIDILKQGSKKIVEYKLDLFRSPDADPLFRTKLMVVGLESVGKTTILDCLFPLEGWAESQGKLKKTRYWFKLQGKCLSKFYDQGDAVPHKGRVTVLENREWTVSSVASEYFVLKLAPSKKIKGKEMQLYFPDKEIQEVWFARLKKVCMNEATLGIEIQSMEIDNAITQEYFKAKDDNNKGKGKLEMSVWDFAGQHDLFFLCFVIVEQMARRNCWKD